MHLVQFLIRLDIIIFYYYFLCPPSPTGTKKPTRSLATCGIRRQVEPRYQVAYPFFLELVDIQTTNESRCESLGWIGG